MEEKQLIERLKKHVEGGEAFMDLKSILKEIDFDKIGHRPENLPYSIYEQFYHIRATQLDILKFITENNYSAPGWPEAYWPEKMAPDSETDWEKLKTCFFEDRQELLQVLESSQDDLFNVVKNGKNDQTLIREILLVIEHNAYHTGQLLVLMRLLNLHK